MEMASLLNGVVSNGAIKICTCCLVHRMGDIIFRKKYCGEHSVLYFSRLKSTTRKHPPTDIYFIIFIRHRNNNKCIDDKC